MSFERVLYKRLCAVFHGIISVLGFVSEKQANLCLLNEVLAVHAAIRNSAQIR